MEPKSRVAVQFIEQPPPLFMQHADCPHDVADGADPRLCAENVDNCWSSLAA